MDTVTRSRAGERWRWITAGLEAVIAASAIYGGIGLIAGNAIGMPDDWLAGTSFTSWVLPGILLLIVVAVPMTVAAALELRRSPWAAVASANAGAAQVGWIAGELLVMQRYNVLQPVMTILGLLILVIVLVARRHEPLWPIRR